MVPVLTAPIAFQSVARVGEPDISEAITRSSCTDKPPSCESAQSSRSPAIDFLVLDGSPEALDKNVVSPCALAIHAD